MLLNRYSFFAQKSLGAFFRVFLFAFIFSSTLFASSYKVGVIYWSNTIECQLLMQEGLESEAKKINSIAKDKNETTIELILRYGGDGSSGITNQVEAFEEFLKLGVDAIIVQPMDSAALKFQLLEANKRGIDVVTFDGYILGGGEIASYIVSDNFMLGYYGGEFMASFFKNDKNLNIVVLDYPNQQNAILRVDGFITALEDGNQNFNILKRYISVEPEGAKRVAKEILVDFPQKNSIDAIFANNDGGSLEVVKALYEASRDEIFFVTIDGDPQSIENIVENRLTKINTAQFCSPLGSEAMIQAYKILKGEKVPKKILLPVFPITKETLDLYPGWGGPIPESFKKPWDSIGAEYWDNSYKLSW